MVAYGTKTAKREYFNSFVFLFFLITMISTFSLFFLFNVCLIFLFLSLPCHIPVCPNPPSFLFVTFISSTVVNSPLYTLQNTICAILIPFSTVNAFCPRFASIIFISPL